MVNDLARLERLDPPAAADVVQRAEADHDLNVRNEVRTQLKTTKALRIGGGKTKPKTPGKATELDLLKEQVAVLTEQVKTLKSEKVYLAEELEKTRQQIADQWKPAE